MDPTLTAGDIPGARPAAPKGPPGPPAVPTTQNPAPVPPGPQGQTGPSPVRVRKVPRIPSARHRRTKGLKPPLGVALRYAALIRSWLDRFQGRILEIVLEGWEQNSVPFGHGAALSRRSDASEFRGQKLGQIKLELEQALDPASLKPGITVIANQVSNKEKTEFRRVIGITSKELGVSTRLRQFQVENISYIKSLAGKQIQDVDAILVEAEAGAWRVEALSAQLQHSFGVTKSKGDLLARDQTLSLNGQLTQIRQTNAGITQYVWTTSNDERVRPSHADLEGTVQDWATPPVIDDDGRTGHPGDDYQCRCTAFPILDELGGADAALENLSSNPDARPGADS